MFKMSEYSFVAGLLAAGLALACYVLGIVLARSSSRRVALAGAGAEGGTVSFGNGSLAAAFATYGTLIGWLSFAFLTAWLIFRTIATGHGPFANQYEFAVSFAWGIVGAYVVFERRYHLRTIGLIVLPIAILTMLYAALFTSSAVEPLVPALQNNLLLTIHVAVAIVAYGSFSVAFGAALLYLVQQTLMDRIVAVGSVAAGIVLVAGIVKGFDFAIVMGGGLAAFLVAGVVVYLWSATRPAAASGAGSRRLPRPEILDEISYRAVVIGFPFLTLVIVLGALWAEVAWGTYWNWDPKETASLVTWLIYGAYLHARVVRGWRGSRSAYLLLLGFYATVFTYFGNLFFGGLHSYSGLSQN